VTTHSTIIVPRPPRPGYQLGGEPIWLWPPYLPAQPSGYQWAAYQSENIVFGGILLPMRGSGGLTGGLTADADVIS